MDPIKLETIHKILVVGGGTMGLRIGLKAVLNGYQCTIYDTDREAMQRGAAIQKALTEKMVNEKQLTNEQRQAALDAILWTNDPEQAAADIDLVSESVTEDVLIKNKVWQQFGQLCPPRSIFTTNTSYLLPSMFASISGRPELFCALHFHDVFYANVVDIMPHEGTAPWVPPLLEKFGKSLQQIPVMVNKESSGYIFNHMLMALIGAAASLVTADITSIENVDRSWMGNFKTPKGPFGILDEVGLDTAWQIVRTRKDRNSQLFAALLEDYVKQGKLGQKTGSGFYNYPNPRFQDADFIEDH